MSVPALYDDDAEQAVLGAVMLDNALLDEIATMLAPDDFAREAWQLVFRAMLMLSAENQPIDTRTISNELRRENMLMRVGVANVAALDTMTPASASWRAYAGIVRDFSRRRATVAACMKTIEAVRDTSQAIVNVVGNAQETLAAVQDDKQAAEFVPFAKVLGDVFMALERKWEGKEKVVSIETGLSDLDRMTSGFRPGEMVVIGGIPGSGKTSFAMMTALRAAALEDAGPVLIFEQEMERDALVHRILSSDARVHGQRFRDYAFIPSDFARIAGSMERIHRAKLDIECADSFTVHDIRARCRRAAMHFKRNPSVVVIDYLQAMASANTDPRASEEAHVREFAMGAKRIAMEFGCVVIALSQLNRKYEDRADKRPSVGDLRGSGAVAAWADAVLLVYRDGLSDGKEQGEGECEIIVGKNRHGPPGSVKVKFDGTFTTFRDATGQR